MDQPTLAVSAFHVPSERYFARVCIYTICSCAVRRMSANRVLVRAVNLSSMTDLQSCQAPSMHGSNRPYENARSHIPPAGLTYNGYLSAAVGLSVQRPVGLTNPSGLLHSFLSSTFHRAVCRSSILTYL